MKFIINKKNTVNSITLDLESTATVNELFLALYEHRSKNYKYLSLTEYQKFISVYQCFLYGDPFRKKWLPDTNLADYELKDPCHLICEEFTEDQLTHESSYFLGSRALLWQSNVKPEKSENEEDVLVQSSSNIMK